MFDFVKKIFKRSPKYDFYYFSGKNIKNAGDVYNIDLVNYFGIKYKKVKKIKKSNLICVGSNLDKLKDKSHKKLLIAGAGFMLPPEEDYISRKVEVLSLRGKLSLKRMQDLLKKPLEDCVLGDPGILISKIYPQNMTKRFKVGIILHYSDKKEWDDSKIKIDKANYKLIDILQDAETLVKEMSECKCILSSSLHGLIFADSYNIPNRQLIMGENLPGGSYKFEDYYSAFDMSLPDGIDMRENIIDEDLVNSIIKSYIIKNITDKQEELAKVFEKLAKNS